MSTDPSSTSAGPPAEAGAAVPETRTIMIPVVVGDVLKALRDNGPAVQQALQQMLGFPQLVDDEEISALVDNRLLMFRTGVEFPDLHLSVILGRSRPPASALMTIIQDFAGHGDPAVAGLALQVLGKHGGQYPGFRDRIAREIVNEKSVIIIAAVRALGSVTVEIEQTLEDLLRAALHAWTYFKGDGQQDGIRGEVYRAIAQQLGRLTSLELDLRRRLRTELNLSIGCPNEWVRTGAKEAMAALEELKS